MTDNREMDHICYRCESKEEYLFIISSLIKYGELLVESMIGGRPISVILLTQPIRYNSFEIRYYHKLSSIIVVSNLKNN